MKYVSLSEEWETFVFRFTIFYPIELQGDEFMISTDRTDFKLVKMARTKSREPWMPLKYG